MKRNDLIDLIDAWQNSPLPSTKLTTYFSAYCKLFSGLRGQECIFIETGILCGGSLHMWRKWLGPKARIIGIDLNPAAEKHREAGFEIFIGDQGDPNFWEKTLPQIGSFDVLLDDGGHQSFQQIVTLTHALAHTKNKAIIAIEDTHASFLKDFSGHGKHSFLEFAKDATDILTARTRHCYPERFERPENQKAMIDFRNVCSIEFFNSLVAFKIDPEDALHPKSVWNHLAVEGVSDFRYAGKKSANIDWPDAFETKNIRVDGN